LCDSVCIIAQGRKVLDGSLREIRRGHAGHRYRVEFESITPAVEALMDGGGGLPTGTRVGDGWELDLPTPEEVRSMLTRLSTADSGVARFEHLKPTLHQIFVEQVGSAQIAERQEMARA
ncbi:MAG: DUF4162 domain-containing protein, partial [Vicinamibacterales bacterium]